MAMLERRDASYVDQYSFVLDYFICSLGEKYWDIGGKGSGEGGGMGGRMEISV